MITLLCLSNILCGQSYNNVRAKQDGLSICITYDMDGKLFRGDKVGLVYSLDDGKNYSIVTGAEGDIGPNVLPGKDNEINWLLIDKDFIIGKIINFRVFTIPQGMVYVDGGSFMRNSISKNENSSHLVELGSFLIDETEVTQREYRQVMGKYASDYAGCMECPVENVSWYDATDYAKKIGKRLPTEAEWEYAALALVGDREYNNYRGKKKYPWSGEYTRSSDRRTEGDQLANFKLGKGDYGGIAGWSDDGADITIQVKQYPPNDFGVYDMAGNVAEWVSDVYRPIVDDEANDFNYYRGNVYTKSVIGEDGKAVIIAADQLIFDTLPNGKVLLKRLPGELEQVAIDENETFLRENFSESDNRNFRDGDTESTRNFASGKPEEGIDQKPETTQMYDAPTPPKVTLNADGELVREYDRNPNRTTLITDEVRVYKGGSWKDRAYWLDPAQRRYLPQYIATDYIGFRCAMSRLGSKSQNKKRARHKRKG